MSTVELTELEDERQARRDFKTSIGRSTEDRTPGVWGLNDPVKYESTYGKAPAFNKGDPLGRIFMDGRGKHREPLVERNHRVILPGITSFDHDVLKHQREFSSEMDRKLPITLDANKEFTTNGVHASFKNVKGVAGYMQNPMSAKPVDNTLLRKELGLNAAYTKRQREIAVMVWNLVWSVAKPSRVNVPKMSAGGMRRMSYDAQWKLDYARWKTVPARYDQFLNAVERGDSYWLANEMEIVYGMYLQKRLQLDAAEKVRYAFDWTYALSGGARGLKMPTDKKVILPDGSRWDDFSGLRVRVIDAGPWAINCDLQMVASSHMRALFERFPRTFHVNTKDEITSVVDGKFVFCSDVSEYDQSMSGDAVSVVFETMRNFYPEGICRSAERLYESPYFARPLQLDGTKGMWIKDPMDWTFKMNSGNRSGHAFTSLVAKVNKVIETLSLFDLMYVVTEANVRRYLEGSMPIGLVNNGDDEIAWTDTALDMRRFRALRSDLKLGHYVVTSEVGQGFSGLLLVRPDPTKQVYVPTPRLQTPFEKCYVPERSIGTAMRKFWPIGWLDRIDTLHSSDAGREAYEIHNFSYRKHLEPRHGTLAGILARGLEGLPHLGKEFTLIEREVLAEPDKLHYKYDEDDVSEKVLNMITSNIPSTYVAGWLRRYYTGTLI